MLEILKEGPLIINAAHNSFHAVHYGHEAATAKTQEMYTIFSHFT